jgi:hypothetical protein
MDTRTKILTLDAARALRPAAVVASRFDVARAAHLRDLDALPRPLLAVVLHCADSVLPVTARADLAAALRVIDYVVIADDRELEALVSALQSARVIHLEETDRRRAAELKQHVQRRQSA